MPKCKNCHIDLDGIRLINHEKYCIQNIKYCEKCQQAIPKDEFEEHLSNHLSRIQSKEIKNEEKKEENNLIKEESAKLQCEFCEQLLSLDLVEEHEKMCGSRTDNCINCGKLIRKKDMKNHLQFCIQEKFNQNNNNYNYNYSNSDYNNNNFDNEYEKYKRQNLMNSTIKNMNEDEQIARAINESLKEQPNKNLNNNFQSKN